MGEGLGALSLVIPCYNEAAAAQSVLERCQEFKATLLQSRSFASVEILVVDDGSKDESCQIINQMPDVRLVKISDRRGYGAALKEGFRHANGDWIAMMDMDATYDPMDFLKALPLLRRDPQHVVLGDRLSQIGGMPFTRRVGNRLFVSLIRALHRQMVLDSCTGFRIFPKSWILPIAESLPDDLNFSLAMTLRLLKQGDLFTEMPISYASRKGRSKLNIVFHGFEFLWTIVNPDSKKYFTSHERRSVSREHSPRLAQDP